MEKERALEEEKRGKVVEKRELSSLGKGKESEFHLRKKKPSLETKFLSKLCSQALHSASYF